MDATAVAIGSAVLAAIITRHRAKASDVPASSSARSRTIAQRSQLYMDLLTEAYADMQYIRHAMASPDVRERAAEWFQLASLCVAWSLCCRYARTSAG